MGRSLTRLLALVVAVTAAAVLAPTSSVAAGINVRGPKSGELSVATSGPPATASFYVYGSDIDVCGLRSHAECPLYSDGESEMVPPAGGMTILDFGAPCFEPATLAWGTQLFNSQGCTPDATIVMLARAWLRGYEANPNRTSSGSYVLALGTSNSLTAAVPGYALTPAEMTQHGQAWFRSVVNPIASIARRLPTPVATWAANDIEESSGDSWYDGPTTIAWVDGYAAAAGVSKPCVASRDGLMVDYGDYVPSAPGWTPDAVYHVSWQSAPACPVPEIYHAVNADEWQSLNRYALSVGLPPIQFTGVLSEDGAAGSLSGSDSWNTLKSATGQAAPYLSVIGETGPLPPQAPDPPRAVVAIPGPGLATVRWSAPAWDGGSAVTAYTVTVYAGSSVVQVVTVSGSPAPETTIIGGLTNGSLYTVYVSATNRVGTGPQSPRPTSVAPSGHSPMR